MKNGLFLGIDVGTGSARAGLFDAQGELLGVGRHDILLFREDGGIAEQSGDDIWSAVTAAVRTAVAEAAVDPRQISGIGIDAACSQVVVAADGAPLPVGPSGDPARNVIVWMDHRALEQAARINDGGHEVLRYVGGRISPEMQTPKVLWLREHMPRTYAAAAHFFDLADYLSWRATGDVSRSACTVACKWTYLAHERRWDEAYFDAIGLGDLATEGFARIGPRIVDPGTPLANGLSSEAAAAMGLVAGTPVGAGLIDAHAGGLGTVGGRGGPGTISTRLGYVFGTSACTMTSTARPVFVPGVWGPYYSAMVPGLWLLEGGQSAAGATLDHLIASHPRADQARAEAARAGVGVERWLTDQVLSRIARPADAIHLAGPLTVVPDFNGNRAPLADPDARGIVAGLSLESGLDDLIGLFVAGIAGIACGLRQILEVQRSAGVTTEAVVISGGAGASPLVRTLLADVTGLPVSRPGTDEPVLLGAALLGAKASEAAPDLGTAMAAMSSMREVSAASPDHRSLHDARYATFLALQAAALGRPASG